MNRISTLKWCGAALVFAALTGQPVFADDKSPKADETAASEDQVDESQVQSTDTACAGDLVWDPDQGKCVEVVPEGGKKTKKVKVKKIERNAGSSGAETGDVLKGPRIGTGGGRPPLSSPKVKVEGKTVTPTSNPTTHGSMTQQPDEEEGDGDGAP